MTQREQMFTNYFCLSVYTMRIAAYSLEMASSYCASHKIKRTLQIAQAGENSRIADVTLKLRHESRNDILQDLASEDLKALGSILHELILLPSITDGEDALIGFIKSVKEVQHDKMEREASAAVESSGQNRGLPGNEAPDEKPFQWPAIPKKEKQAT